MRAEFQIGFHIDYARSQTYEFVVDNFDFEQLRLFEELQDAKHGDRLRAVKSQSQIMRDRKLVWMSKISIELRFQMDHNAVASATALTKSLGSYRQGSERYSSVYDNHMLFNDNEFTVSFKHCTQLSGIINPAEAMTIAQAKEASKVLRKLDGKFKTPMVFKLLVRFTGLLKAYTYRESRQTT